MCTGRGKRAPAKGSLISLPVLMHATLFGLLCTAIYFAVLRLDAVSPAWISQQSVGVYEERPAASKGVTLWSTLPSGCAGCNSGICADSSCPRLQGNVAKYFLDDQSMRTYEELSSRTIELKLVRAICCTASSRMMT